MKERHQNVLDLIIKVEDPIEKGRLLKSLQKDEIRIVDISKVTGYTTSHISNLIRLCRLPDMVLDGYYGGTIKYTHLVQLSRLKDTESMVEIYEKILKDEINTSTLDELIRQKLHHVSTKGEKVSKETVISIEEDFKKISPDFNIKIIQTKVSAKLIASLKGNNEKTTQALEKLAKILRD